MVFSSVKSFPPSIMAIKSKGIKETKSSQNQLFLTLESRLGAFLYGFCDTQGVKEALKTVREVGSGCCVLRMKGTGAWTVQLACLTHLHTAQLDTTRLCRPSDSG